MCILLSDNTSFFVGKEAAEGWGIFAGATLTAAQLFDLKKSSELINIRKCALNLLARAEHSRAQLRIKLIKRGYAEGPVATVLKELEDSGSLSDERFTEQYIRSRLKRHPVGKTMLYARLLNKGVARETAEQVLSCCLSEEDEWDSISRASEKLRRRQGMNEEKLIRTLYARGFSSALIRDYLQRKPI
ncbi:MAG: regulatory protein RecX [Spirochaetota bacterium]